MFWSVFEKMCAQNGETPNGVAKKMGLSNATTTKWKNGSTPSGKTLQKLADYFHCSVDYLLGNTDVVVLHEVELSETEEKFIKALRSISKDKADEILRMVTEKVEGKQE